MKQIEVKIDYCEKFLNSGAIAAILQLFSSCAAEFFVAWVRLKTDSELQAEAIL